MLGQLLNNCGVTRPHGRLWGWANVAVLYQSDDVWATGLHDSVAEAMEAEPTMNISLSVAIASTADAALGIFSLKQAGLRCVYLCGHSQ